MGGDVHSKTYVRIPQGLSSTVTIAALARSSSIFFVVVKTVSVGETVTTLESSSQLTSDDNSKHEN